MSSFLKKYKGTPQSDKGIPNIQMNRPFFGAHVAGDVGIEMEVEGTGLPNTGMLDGVRGATSGSTWQAKQDGSLRGGMEYVCMPPCKIAEVPTLVNGFFETLGDIKTKLRNSNRCSTHVHVNVSSYKVNQLTSILALWSVFENAAIMWCGEERVSNHFCLGSDNEKGVIQAWVNFLKTGVAPNDRNLKYSALNVLPLVTQGSFEFRSGGPPEDAESIIEWAKFVYGLSTFAATKYPNPHQIAFDLSERGATEMLNNIKTEAGLSDSFVEKMVEPFGVGFDMACLKNFRNSQPIVLGFPWDEWLEEINKEFVPNPFNSPKRTTRLNPDFVPPLPEFERGR